MDKLQAKKIKPLDVLLYNCYESDIRSENLIERVFITVSVEDCAERDFEDDSIVHRYTSLHTRDAMTGMDMNWGVHMYMTPDRFNILYESMAYLLRNNYDVIIRKKEYELDDPYRKTIAIIDNINRTIEAAYHVISSPVFKPIVENTIQEVYEDMDKDTIIYNDSVSNILTPIVMISELKPLNVKEEEDKDTSKENDQKDSNDMRTKKFLIAYNNDENRL